MCISACNYGAHSDLSFASRCVVHVSFIRLPACTEPLAGNVFCRSPNQKRRKKKESWFVDICTEAVLFIAPYWRQCKKSPHIGLGLNLSPTGQPFTKSTWVNNSSPTAPVRTLFLLLAPRTVPRKDHHSTFRILQPPNLRILCLLFFQKTLSRNPPARSQNGHNWNNMQHTSWPLRKYPDAPILTVWQKKSTYLWLSSKMYRRFHLSLPSP